MFHIGLDSSCSRKISFQRIANSNKNCTNNVNSKNNYDIHFKKFNGTLIALKSRVCFWDKISVNALWDRPMSNSYVIYFSKCSMETFKWITIFYNDLQVDVYFLLQFFIIIYFMRRWCFHVFSYFFMFVFQNIWKELFILLFSMW